MGEPFQAEVATAGRVVSQVWWKLRAGPSPIGAACQARWLDMDDGVELPPPMGVPAGERHRVTCASAMPWFAARDTRGD